MLRIRIRMFLGLKDPNPDSLVRGTHPDSYQNVTDLQHFLKKFYYVKIQLYATVRADQDPDPHESALIWLPRSGSAWTHRDKKT